MQIIFTFLQVSRACCHLLWVSWREKCIHLLFFTFYCLHLCVIYIFFGLFSKFICQMVVFSWWVRLVAQLTWAILINRQLLLSCDICMLGTSMCNNCSVWTSVDLLPGIVVIRCDNTLKLCSTRHSCTYTYTYYSACLSEFCSRTLHSISYIAFIWH